MKKRILLFIILYILSYTYAFSWENPYGGTNRGLENLRKTIIDLTQQYSERKSNERDEELQATYERVLTTAYLVAQQTNIKMPPRPSPPYTYEQVMYYATYLSNEQQKQLEYIDTLIPNLAKMIDNASEDKNPVQALMDLKEDIYYKEGMKFISKNSFETYRQFQYYYQLALKESQGKVNPIYDKKVGDLFLNLTDMLYGTFEEDNPEQALKDLEENLYFKEGMEYMKEFDYDRYFLIRSEYMQLLDSLVNKKLNN